MNIKGAGLSENASIASEESSVENSVIFLRRLADSQTRVRARYTSQPPETVENDV